MRVLLYHHVNSRENFNGNLYDFTSQENPESNEYKRQRKEWARTVNKLNHMEKVVNKLLPDAVVVERLVDVDNKPEKDLQGPPSTLEVSKMSAQEWRDWLTSRSHSHQKYLNTLKNPLLQEMLTTRVQEWDMLVTHDPVSFGLFRNEHFEQELTRLGKELVYEQALLNPHGFALWFPKHAETMKLNNKTPQQKHYKNMNYFD